MSCICRCADPSNTPGISAPFLHPSSPQNLINKKKKKKTTYHKPNQQQQHIHIHIHIRTLINEKNNNNTMHITNPNRPEEEKHIHPRNPKSRRRRKTRREKHRSKGVDEKQARRRPKQNHPLLHLETTTTRRKFHGKKDCSKRQEGIC
jgi:hypothetical protein